MKALIFDGKVVDVQESEFEVHESMTWVDCDSSVKIDYYYNDGIFTSNEPSTDEIISKNNESDQQLANLASGYQKLVALGLTEAEAEIITGYKPPAE